MEFSEATGTVHVALNDAVIEVENVLELLALDRLGGGHVINMVRSF
jgi:hypothetical protein